MRDLKKILPVVLLSSAGFLLTGCFDDEEPASEKYKEWREQNEQYIADAIAKKDDSGQPYYTKIVPSWAPNTYVLMHWHNDPALTASNLQPMDNSTTEITYALFNVKGEAISSSFARPDSIYTSRPSQNIIGMWAALTRMHVGDSVTMVIPSEAGYGEYSSGSVPPYSTLVYNVKLKAVTAYEVP